MIEATSISEGDGALSAERRRAGRAVSDRFREFELARLALAEAVSEWDGVDGWLVDGMRSPAKWLEHHLRIGRGRAMEMSGFARGLSAWPEIAKAIADAQISTGQAEQLLAVFTAKRAGHADRDVAMLIAEIGRLPVSRVRTVAQYWAARVDAELEAADRDPDQPTPEPTEKPSELDVAELLDGVVNIAGMLNAADGEVVRTALEAARRLTQPGDPTDTRLTDHESEREDGVASEDAPVDPRTPAQQRADALSLICRYFLDNYQTLGTSGGYRPHVSVTIDLDVLAGKTGGLASGEYASAGLSAAAALQLCCDASVSRVLTSAGSLVLDVGRETRAVSGQLRKAIEIRDHHCRAPGCTMPARFTECHHVQHWPKGGATSRANLCLLCHFHHRLVHRGGWTLTGNANGPLLFTSPDGTTSESRPPPSLLLR